MKNTIKTLTLASMIALSLTSVAQTEWSLTGNNISNTTPPPSPPKLGTTDGKEVTASNTKDGSNFDGAFVLAPWASQSNSDIGGMRMEANGDTEFHGTLRATKMNVDVKWWADFVFDADYELKSLAEVEAYILANKHLPNVPSEEEVLANGLDLGEMQAIQQQKIEELTLYIIQQQKQIDALLQTVNQLKK